MIEAPYIPPSAPLTDEQRAWLNGLFAQLVSPGSSPALVPALEAYSGDGHHADAIPGNPGALYDRRNPFPAELLSARRLTAAECDRDVRHVVLSLEGSQIRYHPGDALGVMPCNAPGVVDTLLRAVALTGDEPAAPARGSSGSLRDALIHDYDVETPSRSLLETVAKGSDPLGLRALLSPERKADLSAFLHGRSLADLVRDARFTATSAETLVSLLRPLQPRLYSISSSQLAHPEEVHLTVGVVRYEAHGRARCGVCSTYLAERASGPVPVYLHENRSFRLPSSAEAPIVMVGPGTGIAPFRAFLEEQRELGRTNPTWLFFGNRHAAREYLYADELRALLRQGVLTRLDTAFSRDQSSSIYVQHRMLEHASELYAWLEEGAYFYVCGDAARMARDVDAALRQVVQRGGGLNADAADAYVDRLRNEKRYARDVY